MKSPAMPTLVLLAGGLATRLRPLTIHLPKALIPIAGKPFIEQQLELIAAQGFSAVVICAGFLGNQIQEFVGNGARFGLSVNYSFDGETLLGTGGAIKKALPLLGETFAVMYGDSYLPASFRPAVTHFAETNTLGLMTVFRNDNQWDKSNIEFINGRIFAYDKKLITAQMHYIDYGFGLFRPTAFANFPDHQTFDLAAVYQSLLKQQQLAAYEVHQRFYEIGSVAGMQDLEKYIKERDHVFH